LPVDGDPIGDRFVWQLESHDWLHVAVGVWRKLIQLRRYIAYATPRPVRPESAT
jgi:hypothetical protein